MEKSFLCQAFAYELVIILYPKQISGLVFFSISRSIKRKPIFWSNVAIIRTRFNSSEFLNRTMEF